MTDRWKGPLERLDKVRWIIPRTYKKGMNTEGIIFAAEDMIEAVLSDQAPEQVANVACMPGIVGRSMAMPDIHWGYGFPIGGVAAFGMDEGVVSPGGVGFDINCGVCLLRTELTAEDVTPRIKELVTALYRDVPSGLGSEGKQVFSLRQLKDVLRGGARSIVKRGFGWNEDTTFLEEGGAMEGANPDEVSEKALKRGMEQIGTLGSGNHFLEVEVVDEIFRSDIARCFGLFKGQVVVMIHTGSRGFGHQVCTDSLRFMQSAMKKYGIHVPDRQLACAPLFSSEGKTYLAAMACAANFAWANRQFITHHVRESFEKIFGSSAERLGMHVLYDVAHNIAKIERHEVGGEERDVCVHRKGATRAFAAGDPVLPEAYRAVGQPVLIPGDMGTGSYILVGTQQAMKETFGSTCHGAGRILSRSQADKRSRGRDIEAELLAKGIMVMAKSRSTLREEVTEAYKSVKAVVETVEQSGISLRVASTRPLGVVKG